MKSSSPAALTYCNVNTVVYVVEQFKAVLQENFDTSQVLCVGRCLYNTSVHPWYGPFTYDCLHCQAHDASAVMAWS